MLTPEIAAVLRDPASSDWLKAALRDAMARDMVDGVNDAVMLTRLLKVRYALVLAKVTCSIAARPDSIDPGRAL